MTDELLLTADEIAALTTYSRSSAQLDELHRQGFVRARCGRFGAVILERAHYLAVCAGTFGPHRAEPELVLNFEPRNVRRRPKKQG